MAVVLCSTRELPAAKGYDRWFAVAGARPSGLDPARLIPGQARRLEATFEGIRDEWWALGRDMAAEPTGGDSFTAACSAYGTDFGLMLSWARMVAKEAAAPGLCLVVCDDPWLYKHLRTVPGVQGGRAPSAVATRIRMAMRGMASRFAYAAKAALCAVLLPSGRPERGGSVLLVYGHPRSDPGGEDAYFGTMMQDFPALTRAVHTDTRLARSRWLIGDPNGRTISLHAWGNPFFAATLAFRQWRPSARFAHGPLGPLVRRAAAIEAGGGSAAATRWQVHCQDRWLAERRPKVVVWPWENQPWERELCRSARRLGIKTVGYQHTVIGPHQYNVTPFANHDGVDALPDRILANGPAYRDQLIDWGVPPERLGIGGAIRLARMGPNHYHPDGPIFVALSPIRAIAEQMIEAVADAALRSGLVFLVKDHPMYPLRFKERTGLTRTDKTIPEQIGISAVLYATGTSGLEGVLAGVPTFRFLADDRVSIDILPTSITVETVTREDLAARLADPGPPLRVDWHAIMADIDLSVWHNAFFPSIPQ